MGISTVNGTRVPALDGIRGLAIGLVLLRHGVFLPLEHIPNHPHAARILALGGFSWSGVDLFFVLSGFLIGGILLDAAKAERYFAPFYIRRAHRILPLYFAVLVLGLSVSHLCHYFGATGLWGTENRIPLICYATFLQNFWIAIHTDWGSYTFAVTWSLAIEEQFYLTLPAIVRYVSRSRLWWVVGGMIVTAPLLRIGLIHSGQHGLFASYLLTPCRWDDLGFGVAAALIVRNPSVWETVLLYRNYVYVALAATFVGLEASLLFGFTPLTNQAYGLEYSVLGIFYFLLLISVLTNTKLDAAFSTGALRYMGTIAYGLYLLHVPFVHAISDLTTQIHPGQSGWIALGGSVLGIALAAAAAAFSWRYLEKPLIKRGHRYEYWTTPTETLQTFALQGTAEKGSNFLGN